MNDCPRGEMRDLLPDLVHGTLDEPTRAEVESHVRGCPDCAAEVALIRRARQALASDVRVDPAPILAAVQGARARSTSRVRLRQVAAIAAVLVLAVVGLFTVANRESESPAGRAPAIVATTPTPVTAPVDTGDPQATPGPRSSQPRAAAVEPAAVAFGGSDLDTEELEELIVAFASLSAVPDEEPGFVLPSLAEDVQ